MEVSPGELRAESDVAAFTVPNDQVLTALGPILRKLWRGSSGIPRITQWLLDAEKQSKSVAAGLLAREGGAEENPSSSAAQETEGTGSGTGAAPAKAEATKAGAPPAKPKEKAVEV